MDGLEQQVRSRVADVKEIYDVSGGRLLETLEILRVLEMSELVRQQEYVALQEAVGPQ